MDGSELQRRLQGYQNQLQSLHEACQKESSDVAAVLTRMLHVFLPPQGQPVPETWDVGTASRDVQQLQQLAWDKLHLGHWKDVATVWRDLYSVTCLLSATCALSQPSNAQPTAPSTHSTSTRSGATSTTVEPTQLLKVVKELDLGIMMGGPTFQRLLHEAVKQLEAQQKHTSSHPATHPTQPDASAAEAGTVAHLSKRQRTDDDAAMGQAVGAAVRHATAEGATPASPHSTEVRLPPGSLCFSEEGAAAGAGLCQPAPVLHLPSLERFAAECMGHRPHGQPTVITGAMHHWPAMTRWNDLEYLRRMAGHRTVPVEVGTHYLAEGWGQQLMTLSDFIEQHISPRGSDAPTPQQPPVPATQPTPSITRDSTDGPVAPSHEGMDRIATAVTAPQPAAPGRPPGYLAQHPLFDQIPALAQDIREPEYCCLGRDEEEGGGVQAVNAWFGPAGTLTPLHTDPHHNLLCQVVGSKYLRLYSPEHTDAMYPYSEGLTTNSSQVDVMAVDTLRFPNFLSAPYLDCVLQPGQMLYIPPGWWHCVIAMSTSFSVSYWWC